MLSGITMAWSCSTTYIRCATSDKLHDDTKVALKRNLYEPDYGELTRKGKSARQNARVDSYKSAEPH